MHVVRVIGSLLVAYLLGAIPVGLMVVKQVRGRDIRYWFSGRTGGTNVMRMAGFWAGFITAIGDVIKGVLAVWVARFLTEGSVWVEVVAGLLAIMGHNYSIFLVQQKEGKFQLRGGAGGATTIGVAFSLWIPSVLIILPVSILVFVGIGYASIATISIGLASIGLFLWRAMVGLGPWVYVVFGVLAEGMLLWALRPNIQRLLKGEERIVGWRAWQIRRSKSEQSSNDET